MSDVTTATPAAPTRTEDDMVDELTELLFRVKMLEFDLRRLRDPLGPAHSEPPGGDEVDVEREIAIARARSLAKVEAAA